MSDIRTTWGELLTGDWLVAGASLDATGDLETAIILSLFTDGRANADDRLPDQGGDRRGWWGDTGADEGPVGSRLWLLARKKTTRETRLRVEAYAREALAWMLEDGVADRIEVAAEYVAGTPTRLDLVVTITRDGATLFSRRFDPFWQELQS